MILGSNHSIMLDTYMVFIDVVKRLTAVNVPVSIYANLLLSMWLKIKRKIIIGRYAWGVYREGSIL